MHLDTIGKRLTYCRSLLGLSRQDLVDEMREFTLKTLSRWELDQNKIPQLKLNKLVNFLNLKGLIVSNEWVMSGIGIHPLNGNLRGIEDYNFDEIAYMTLNHAKLYIKNFEVFQLNSNFFEPILQFGDYVGGVVTNAYVSVANKLVFIIINEKIEVGIFDYSTTTLKNIYGSVLELKGKSFKIGQVIWMTKRF